MPVLHTPAPPSPTPPAAPPPASADDLFRFHPRASNPELWRTTVPLVVRERCGRHKGLIATWTAIHWLIVLYAAGGRRAFGMREIAQEAGVGRNELAGTHGHIQRLVALGLLAIVGYEPVPGVKEPRPIYHIDLADLERQSLGLVPTLLRERRLPAPPRPAPDPRQLALFPDGDPTSLAGPPPHPYGTMEIPTTPVPPGAPAATHPAGTATPADGTGTAPHTPGTGTAPHTTGTGPALIGTALPGTGTGPALIGTALPGTGTGPALIGTALPGTGTALPGTGTGPALIGTALPGTGTAPHATGTGPALIGTALPGTGTALPGTGTAPHATGTGPALIGTALPGTGTDHARNRDVDRSGEKKEQERERQSPPAPDLVRSIIAATTEAVLHALQQYGIIPAAGPASTDATLHEITPAAGPASTDATLREITPAAEPASTDATLHEITPAAEPASTDTIPLAPAGQPALHGTIAELWRGDREALSPREQTQLALLANTYDGPTGGFGAYWVGRAIVLADVCLTERGRPLSLAYLRSMLRRWHREGSWGSDLLGEEPPAPRRAAPSAAPADGASPRPAAPPPTSDGQRDMPALRAGSLAPPAAPDSAHPAVAAYRAAFGESPNAVQAQQIAAQVADLSIWRQVLSDWQLNGWGERSVGKMLDRYQKATGTAPGAPGDPAAAPVSVAAIHTYPGLTDEQRDRWIHRFHAATSPSEKRAVIARMEAEGGRLTSDVRRAGQEVT